MAAARWQEYLLLLEEGETPESAAARVGWKLATAQRYTAALRQLGARLPLPFFSQVLGQDEEVQRD